MLYRIIAVAFFSQFGCQIFVSLTSTFLSQNFKALFAVKEFCGGGGGSGDHNAQESS
jgi:hypothetical protein